MSYIKTLGLCLKTINKCFKVLLLLLVRIKSLVISTKIQYTYILIYNRLLTPDCIGFYLELITYSLYYDFSLELYVL